MRTAPARPFLLLLSVLPDGCARRIDEFRGQGMTVKLASRPDRALELLRDRPNLVLVDLVHGPGLDARVVRALNRPPRPRVVVLHDGTLNAWFGQVQHLAVDGFCRIESTVTPARQPS